MFKIPIIGLIFILVGCVHSGSKSDDAPKKDNGLTSYQISEIGLKFNYSDNEFKLVDRDNYIIGLYPVDKTSGGPGVIDFRYTPKDYRPGYETWISDHGGDIGSNTTIETLCSYLYLKIDLIINCMIVDDPVPHIEFFMADNNPTADIPGQPKYGMVHKLAFFYTKNENLPGLFISVQPKDISSEWLYADTEEEMKEKLKILSSDGSKVSKYMEAFEKVIQSIQFK